MIKLEVEEYCQNCNSFNPSTKVVDYCSHDGCKHDTRISCENRDICENIHTYILEHELKKL